MNIKIEEGDEDNYDVNEEELIEDNEQWLKDLSITEEDE